ncbi:MAG: fumarylacetoacetate hydrolase family protein [Schaalia hyovaginalis]|uniref:fumarylacetoacetate hydrolase family protein n=1 Tax=Schaalia hyovaginalis TaxID=29316 RepID=UPI002A90A79C|nr:fumarylacetoacetate hydrolase family protein [Schaalia hyovaginalis]MDY5600401.1 fumarylacetoacetate hydrolase family protein [Schaalia hyovaginalis]
MSTAPRYLRFLAEGEDEPRFGVLAEDSEEILELASAPFPSGAQATGRAYALDSARLLAPVAAPSKIIGIGKNYADHAREMGGEAPDQPVIFLKPSTSIIGPDDPIIRPAWSDEVHHEGELAVVIKTLAKDVPVEEADRVVLGYTIANDVTARDIQRTDAQWTRAKGFDTACPLGPWITADPRLNVDDLRVTTRVDGQTRQDDTTAHMITPVRELISYVSSVFTLLPGDVIITGTPAGVGPIRAGQRVEVEIEGIGVLSNPVVDA